MSMLTIQPSGQSIDVPAGTTLLAAILRSGVSLGHKCDGKAECGSCHLYVLEGRKSLSRTQREENDKLDTIVGVSSKSRLACQAKIGDEPVTIELLSFV